MSELASSKTSSPRTSAQHWLARVAESKTSGAGRDAKVPSSMPLTDAWMTVRRAYGLEDDELAAAVAAYFHLEVADLSDVDPHTRRLLPRAIVQKHLVYPLAESSRYLYVATADPTNVEAEREISFTSGRVAVFRIAAPRAIENAIEGEPDTSVEDMISKMHLKDFGDDPIEVVREMEQEQVGEDEATAPPVVKLTSMVIRRGIKEGASDIHIEPGRKEGVVRYRIDGVLHEVMKLPLAAMIRLVSRIKILADLDISDRLRPQDGKARVRFEDRTFDLRVSTLPSAGGAEKCVIRILDSSASPTLSELGIPEYELGRLRQLMGHRDGVVLVTGPTGSGKTTTLYGVLRELADGKINIMTVEDPVEYEIPQITQTQIQPKQGVTFATALRALLRQDPDVILVGEIRDEETAQVAFRAAMTGHLVLATVHANDAVSAVARLEDLDLDSSTIAGSLRGALAQRLLRRVCPHCATKVEGELSPQERKLSDRHGVKPTVQAVGCDECGFTGYRGRVPVQEVIVADGRFQEAIDQEKDVAALRRAALKGGMRTMHQVAASLVEEGVTTLSELDRVLGQMVEAGEAEGKDGPARILLVEDDEGTRLLITTLLEKNGFEVEEAPDGETAKEILKEKSDFSLVVLDLSLPGIGGFDVLKWIRSRPDIAGLPVLVRTGEGSNAVETELLEAGADDYVTKSVEPPRFIARVKAMLRRAEL